MDYHKRLEELISYASRESIKIYDYLSKESKQELKEYSVQEISSSLNRLFNNKSYSTNDDEIIDYGTVKILLVDLKSKENVFVTFQTENDNWKLIWNKKQLLDYQ